MPLSPGYTNVAHILGVVLPDCSSQMGLRDSVAVLAGTRCPDQLHAPCAFESGLSAIHILHACTVSNSSGSCTTYRKSRGKHQVVIKWRMMRHLYALEASSSRRLCSSQQQRLSTHCWETTLLWRSQSPRRVADQMHA